MKPYVPLTRLTTLCTLQHSHGGQSQSVDWSSVDRSGLFHIFVMVDVRAHQRVGSDSWVDI